jgi:hypothetical protein
VGIDVAIAFIVSIEPWLASISRRSNCRHFWTVFANEPFIEMDQQSSVRAIWSARPRGCGTRR